MRFVLALVAVAGTAIADPVARFAPETGFVDDAFALTTDGKRIAYVTTDGASPSTLHLTTLGGASVTVDKLPAHVIDVFWLDNDRVVVVAEAGARKTAQVYAAKGALPQKLGPADFIAPGLVADQAAVVAYTRAAGKKAVEHRFVAVNAATWKPLGTRALTENNEGRVAHKSGAFKVLWLRDGLTDLAALQSGDYDKARDMRRPDRFARFDVFAGRFFDVEEIGDIIGFAQVGQLHAKHGPGQEFVQLSEDHKQLIVVDGLTTKPIELARALTIYDADAFGWQPLGADRLWVSATVEPANPEALKRQKVDKDDLDIYVVDRKTAAAKRALTLPGQNRPTLWRIGGDHIAVLRKSKGFGRGGVVLEVFDIHAQ